MSGPMPRDAQLIDLRRGRGMSLFSTSLVIPCAARLRTIVLMCFTCNSPAPTFSGTLLGQDLFASKCVCSFAPS